MAYQNLPPSNTGDPSPFYTRVKTLRRALAVFTADRYLAVGTYPSMVAYASRTNNQTAVSGGGVLGPAVMQTFVNNFIQTPKTLPWLAACRGKFTGAFAGANYCLFGPSDGTNEFVRIGYAGGYSNAFFSFDVGHGGASTSAVGTIALDNSTHDHVVYYDGSTAAKYYVDGVLNATISTLTNFPTTAVGIGSMSNGSAANITEIFFSYNETA